MNPQILKLNIDKWLKACQYLKSEYENLNVDEQSAIDILCDFWRRDYSTSLVEECESQMQVLKDGHKYHGNNKTIIEKSKELCAVAAAMLKDAASFGEFKAEMQKLSRGSSSRSSSSASRSSSSSPSSSSSRPSAPRPSSSKPSVVIRSVELRATGANNVALGTSSSTVPVGAQYVYPVLKFDALQADTDIWYKIYDGNGAVVTGTRRQGFSTLGQFKRGATSGECIGIGSEDSHSYTAGGAGRIEFFVNDILIHSHNFRYTKQSQSSVSSGASNVVIRSVEFRATGANKSALGTSSSTVPVGAHYVYPVLKFDALQADTDIWYKIYDGAGVLITGTRRQGFSTVGQFKRGATGGECIGIGSEDGSNYATTGVGRIEFFVNDRLIYTYRFQYVEPPRPTSRPSSSSSSRPSSSSNSSPFASSSRSYSGSSSYSGPSRQTRKSGIKWWAYPLWFFVALGLIWAGVMAYKAFSVKKEVLYPITDLCYMIGSYDDQSVKFGNSIKVEVPEDVTSFYKYNDQLIAREYLLTLEDYNTLALAFSEFESTDYTCDRPDLRAKLLSYLKTNGLNDGSWRVDFANTVESAYKVLKNNFVFIIRNINTGKRLTIVYYDENLVKTYDEEAPAKGMVRTLSRYKDNVKVYYTGTGRKSGRSTTTSAATDAPAPAPASSSASSMPSSSGTSSSSTRPAQSTQSAQSSSPSVDDERAAARRR